ncbi:MAG: PIN domain-containing protein [Prevotella sp.]|nr:PIN domain-containing protein [Prevotella sp.]MBR1449991.1 PIN domain-containing protein [Prevotella sp.]
MEELLKVGKTMKQYLLDTDICIEVIKHNTRVLDKVEAAGEENCFVTDITIAELFFGAAKSGNSDHFGDVDKILQSFDLMPLLPSLRLYGENKALLEEQGRMIGEFDLLIGSCAVYHDLIMVTSNLKHFDHIPDIQLEDWAQKSKYKKQ